VERDPLLRRVERMAIVLCGAMAVAALIVRRGDPDAAMAVLAGGLLVTASYWSLKSGVSGLLPRDGVATPQRRGRIVLQLAGRYALLAFMAYVMIARLRLRPVALLIGASSIVAAVAVEAVRLLVKKS
jgi:hypothetical protein